MSAAASHVHIEASFSDADRAPPSRHQSSIILNRSIDHSAPPIREASVKQRLGLSEHPSTHRSKRTSTGFSALVIDASTATTTSPDSPRTPKSAAPVMVETFHTCVELMEGLRDRLPRLVQPGRAPLTNFLWIDLHGVPCDTSSEETTAVRALWEALGLQGTDVERLEKLRLAVGHNHGGQSAAHLRSSDERSTSSDSSSSSSSGGSESTMEELQDIYDEDLDGEPDSVHLRHVNGTADCEAEASSLPHHGSPHYMMMELATLMEETTSASPAAAGGQRWLRRVQTFTHPTPPPASMTFSPSQQDLDAEAATPLCIGSPRRGNPGSPRWISQGGQPDTMRALQRLGESTGTGHVGRIVNTVVAAFAGGCLTWCRHSEVEVDEAPCSISAAVESARRSFSQVKDWGRLQKSVLSHAKRVAAGSGRRTMMDSSLFLQLLLSTVCYAYLPDTTTVLTEVDAIDSMLPMIDPDKESDQADALRRVQLLRRRLAVHRRLLFQKLRLLDQLVAPSMRTLGSFIQPRATRAATLSFSASVVRTRGPLSQREKGLGFKIIKDDIRRILIKLDTARSVLSNTTLLYTSKVSNMNSTCSTTVDFYMLLLQYVTLLVIPLTIIASQWGMQCVVPGKYVDGLYPFWIICGFMVVVSIAALAYPIWAYSHGRLDLLS